MNSENHYVKKPEKPEKAVNKPYQIEVNNHISSFAGKIISEEKDAFFNNIGFEFLR